VFKVTPDKVEVVSHHDGEGNAEPHSNLVEDIEEARQFAQYTLELWEKLPGAAQTQDNLKALSLAKTLEGYRSH
jgi:hypothetical protein